MHLSTTARFVWIGLAFGSMATASAEPFEPHGVSKGGSGLPAAIVKGDGRPVAPSSVPGGSAAEVPVLIPQGLSRHGGRPGGAYISPPTAFLDARGPGIQFWENRERWDEAPSTVHTALAVGAAKTYGEAKAVCEKLEPKGRWSLPTQSFLTDRLLNFRLFRSIMGSNLLASPYRIPAATGRTIYSDGYRAWWDETQTLTGASPLLFWVFADYADYSKTVFALRPRSKNLEPWESVVAKNKGDTVSTVEEWVEYLRTHAIDENQREIGYARSTLKQAEAERKANSGVFGSGAKFRAANVVIARTESRMERLEAEVSRLRDRAPSVMATLRGEAEARMERGRQSFQRSGAGRYETGVPVVCVSSQETPPVLLSNREYDD